MPVRTANSGSKPVAPADGVELRPPLLDQTLRRRNPKVAGPNDETIERIAPDDPVLALSDDDDIGIAVVGEEDDVVALSSVDYVFSFVSAEFVHPRTAEQKVVAPAAVEVIGAVAARENIVAVKPHHHVGAPGAADKARPGIVSDHMRPLVRDDLVEFEFVRS